MGYMKRIPWCLKSSEVFHNLPSPVFGGYARAPPPRPVVRCSFAPCSCGFSSSNPLVKPWSGFCTLMEGDRRSSSEIQAGMESSNHGLSTEISGAPVDASAREAVLSDADKIRRQEMGGEWFRLSDTCLLALHQGDITAWSVDGRTDAIVNAANTRMLGGGGVDGAIHRAAGPRLLEACRKLQPIYKGVRCRVGDAVITNAFRLPVSKIIHAVGPIYENEESSAPILEKAYKNSLSLAVKEGVKYIAFPAISCGVYGYPYAEGAEVALRTAHENSDGLKEVHFVLFEKGTWSEWLSKARKGFPRC